MLIVPLENVVDAVVESLHLVFPTCCIYPSPPRIMDIWDQPSAKWNLSSRELTYPTGKRKLIFTVPKTDDVAKCNLFYQLQMGNAQSNSPTLVCLCQSEAIQEQIFSIASWNISGTRVNRRTESIFLTPVHRKTLLFYPMAAIIDDNCNHILVWYHEILHLMSGAPIRKSYHSLSLSTTHNLSDQLLQLRKW